MSPYRDSGRASGDEPAFNNGAGADARTRRRDQFLTFACLLALAGLESVSYRLTFEWGRLIVFACTVLVMFVVKRFMDWREARRPDFFTKKLARDTAAFLAPEMALPPATNRRVEVPAPVAVSDFGARAAVESPLETEGDPSSSEGRSQVSCQ